MNYSLAEYVILVKSLIFFQAYTVNLGNLDPPRNLGHYHYFAK